MQQVFSSPIISTGKALRNTRDKGGKGMDFTKLASIVCRFIVTDNCYRPAPGLCIAIEEIETEEIIAYTDYDFYTGSDPNDPDYPARLEAIARMLTYFRDLSDGLNIGEFETIDPCLLISYLSSVCRRDDVDYLLDWMQCMAKNGKFQSIDMENGNLQAMWTKVRARAKEEPYNEGSPAGRNGRIS